MFENLAIRCEEVELVVLSNSLVKRMAIKATKTIMATTTVNPVAVIALMVVTVLVVTVETNLLYLLRT